MIDIHSHILPGLDDGAKDWEESLAMAEKAVQDGTTKMIATPHHKNGMFDTEPEQIRERVELLRGKLAEREIALEIAAGQEIRLYRDLIEDMESGSKLLTLNDSRYVLIEFPRDRIPSSAEEMIYELGIRGKVPIIAHPERNAQILKRPDDLGRLIENGALAQITSHSLTGGFGKTIGKKSIELCKRGYVHLIASDGHHPNGRSPKMADSLNLLEKHFGEGYVRQVVSNAAAIWDDGEVAQPVVQKKSKKWYRFLIP